MNETYEEKVKRVEREITEILEKNGLALMPSISFVEARKKSNIFTPQ